ncbi:MAG: WD40 repeat domain-containing protein [Armatimonadota bacterium]
MSLSKRTSDLFVSRQRRLTGMGSVGRPSAIAHFSCILMVFFLVAALVNQGAVAQAPAPTPPADAPCLVPAIGHYKGVAELVFNADGTRLASVSDDGTVIVWDVLRQRPIHVLSSYKSIVSLAFSPDGRLLAMSTTGKVIVDPVPDVPLTFIGRDPQRPAANQQTPELQYWDLTTGRLASRFTLGDIPLYSIVCHPDGEKWYTATGDGFWVINPAARTWRKLTARPPSSPSWSKSLAFVPPNGLTSLDNDGRITDIDADAGTIRGTRDGVKGRLQLVGQQLLIVSNSHYQEKYLEGEIMLYDAMTRAEVFRNTPGRYSGMCGAVALHPKGTYVAVGYFGGEIYIIARRDNSREFGGGTENDTFSTMILSPTGEHLAKGYPNSTVMVINQQGEHRQFSLDSGRIQAMAFSPDGTKLAICASGIFTEVKNPQGGWIKSGRSQALYCSGTC